MRGYHESLSAKRFWCFDAAIPRAILRSWSTKRLESISQRIDLTDSPVGGVISTTLASCSLTRSLVVTQRVVAGAKFADDVLVLCELRLIGDLRSGLGEGQQEE